MPSAKVPPASDSVTIVTQTRVAAGQDAAFALWQKEIGSAIATHAGFIDEKVIPPSPPEQVDWVILQRFTTADAARAWLNSKQRVELVLKAQGLLAGGDDVHIVADTGKGVLPSPVSAVISTRLKPGQEAEYRQWEQRIAAAQARSPGFEGYRLESPTPGVQDDWLAIVRFDSQANLDRWLNSPERQTLLQDAPHLNEQVHVRVVRTGFDQWFEGAGDEASPPAWKQNMIVLLALYPVVFVFGLLVQQPLLQERAGLPFWLALFIGNVASVILLNWLVPWASRRFGWWLQPKATAARRLNLLGTGLVIGLYGLSLLVFSQL